MVEIETDISMEQQYQHQLIRKMYADSGLSEKNIDAIGELIKQFVNSIIQEKMLKKIKVDYDRLLLADYQPDDEMLLNDMDLIDADDEPDDITDEEWLRKIIRDELNNGLRSE